jgi:neutral ceramidase
VSRISRQAELRAGYAAVDITPPAGVDLTGFIAREGPCLGTLDPLMARALVFEDAAGDRRAALVTCDLIGLGRHLVARVRRRVAAAADIPPEAVLFACSHTHAGPETGVLTTIGLPDPGYLASLEQGLVDALTDASRRLTPVRLRLGETNVEEGVVVNRVFRRVGRPERYDHQLTVVRLEPDGGDGSDATPLATIVAFACHAVALGAGERHASADYVGVLRRDLEVSGSGPVLYVNGCGGDVNPARMDERGRPASEHLGGGLARAAIRALAASAAPEDLAPARPGQTATIGASQEWVTLPLQPLRTAAAAADLLAEGRRKLSTLPPESPAYRAARVTEVDYPLRLLRLHYGSEELPEVQAEVQAVRLGPIAVVALPGEIFSSLGQAIKAASPFPSPRTLIAGWANDNVGYIPDGEAYPLGGYEVDSASRYYGYPAGWAAAAGEALVAAADRVLGRLAGPG